MKVSRTWFAAIGSAWLIALLAVLPFQPGVLPGPVTYQLEFAAAPATATVAQVFYDRGSGFNEDDSAIVALPASSQLKRHQLPLPSGRYHALRLDPLQGSGAIVLHDVAIRDPRGRVALSLPATAWRPLHEVATLEARGDAVWLQTTTDAVDPQVLLPTPEEFELPPLAIWQWAPYLGSVAITGLLLSVLFLAAPRLRVRLAPRLRPLGDWFWNRPRRLILALAVVSVVASTYPVVFLGKSFVSPNYGTILLYEEWPTLPGSKDRGSARVGASDVGAIMWGHVPYSFIQHQALWRDAELPLWNRYSSTGLPLLGQGQSGFGDPLHLLLPVLFGPSAWSWDLKYLLAKVLFAAGLGLTTWQVVRDRRAAGLTTVLAPFIGFFLYRINHPAFFSLCYAPWILFAYERLRSAGTARGGAGAALLLVLANTAVLTSGTVKEAYMLLFGLNFTGGMILLLHDEPWRRRVHRLGLATLAGIGFVGLTAPVWLTFWDTLRAAYTSYDAPSAYQTPPGLALGVFDEIFFRPFQHDNAAANPSLNFAFLLALAWVGIRARTVFTDRFAVALAVSALPVVALIFGVVSPYWIVQVPFLRNVAHLDNSFLCVLIVQLSLLAGYGWREGWARLATPAGRGDLVVLAVLVAVLFGGYLGTLQAVQRTHRALLVWGETFPLSEFTRTYAWSLGLGLALTLLGARGWRTRGPTLPVVTLTLLGLVLLVWRFGWHAGAGWPEAVVSARTRPDFSRPSPAIEAVKGDQPEPSRAVGFRGNLFPGWSASYGLEGISGPDALMSPWYRELAEAAGLERLWDWRIMVTHERFESLRPVYDLLGVRHYLDLRGDLGRLGQWFTPVKLADLDVYRSETAWPRAFFVGRVFPYEQVTDFANRLHRSTRGPFAGMDATELAASPAAALADPAGSATAEARPATDYHLTTNRTRFRIDAPAAGLAVLQEAYWPKDFTATVNGRAAPVLRVNHAFKGVYLPAAGTYEIAFTYRPHRFELALGAAAGGLLIVLFFGLGAWRPRLLRLPEWKRSP